jgi:outer membrane receptor protein involved in Fe transport
VPSPSFIAQATLTSPALLPILTAYPVGASPTTSPNVWNYNALGRPIDNEDSGMTRLDYHLSDKTTSFVRFNSDEAVQTIPTGQLIAKTQYDTKFNNGAFEILHVFSPSLVNEFKFGVNQHIYIASTLSPVPFTISVSGFSSLAGRTTNQNPSKTISLQDDVSWSKGSHTLKFGFEFKRLFLNQGTASSGTLTYTSTTNFLNNQMGTASYTSILPLVRQRKNMYWTYVEDEWKVTPRLTINAGLRYNVFNALSALKHLGHSVRLCDLWRILPNSYSYFNPRYNDVDPRIGIAWSHRNTGGTHRRRHLSHRRTGGRSEPSYLEHCQPLLVQQSRSRAFAILSSRPISRLRAERRVGRSLAARSGSQPEGQLCCRLDVIAAADPARRVSSHTQLRWQ